MKLCVLFILSLCSLQLFAYERLISCSTFSNDIHFSGIDSYSYKARDEAVDQCARNSYTDLDECKANICCNDGSKVRPVLTCVTRVDSFHFSDKSRDLEIAKKHAITKCLSHFKTTRNECSENIKCYKKRRPIRSANYYRRYGHRNKCKE